MKRRARWISLGSLIVVAACSPAPAPVSQSPNDPSNPHAAEGVTLATPASAPPPAAGMQDSNPHAGHIGHGSAAPTTTGGTDAGAMKPAAGK